MPKLALSPLTATRLQIPGADRWYANPGDPALSVMTDFRERSSVTVSEALPIDAALEHMKHTGVRCAFAIDEPQRQVAGLITAYDIMGEKPMRHMQATSTARSHIRVKDLMTGLPDWQVVDVRQVERHTVAAVAKLFDESLLTHIVVTETDEQGVQRLRGILSASKVRRLLSR
jgi:CBS-domain-containing membrane protein